MNFNRINNIVGWIVGLFACGVYILTMEATGSLWDCGEFLSCGYKLQIPHPPGAPLQILLQRLFMIWFPANPAIGGNLLSALASGFTILFLFWTITHFGRKLLQKNGAALTGTQLFSVMTAGVVGALAYTFSDSFWFSAVEGEVYAMSSFFTAIVFWAALKWEEQADRPGADKWLILIFYLIGLSIGVHLLSLLCIPAIVMLYYFKRYKVTAWGTVAAFAMGCIVLGVTQVAVIQWTIKAAGKLDVPFVNTLGLPFFSGFIFFFILMAALIFIGLRIAAKKDWKFLRLGLWCFTFVLIGYSTYLTTLVRSNANPAIDMYNVDNPFSLQGYLGREQYGDFPVLYGQYFTDEYERDDQGQVVFKEGSMRYARGKDKYTPIGIEKTPQFPSTAKHFFPRMWSSDDRAPTYHATFYANWVGIQKYQDRQTGEVSWEREPNFGDNVKYFVGYQFNTMYLRYFLWNFMGKQNDMQGFGGIRDGGAITGISFIDDIFYPGDSSLPDSIKNSKGRNKLYALPLILGIIGIIYHYKRNRHDFFVNFLLFFFTGFAIIVYVNQPGNQPRERDYAYVGSFYAFAVWIGIGVLMVKEWFDKILKGSSHIAAAALCTLAVPVLMAQQEWDDHDRSQKTIALDLATDYLESCDKNAILFTFGDNDTYPLWFAQEVMGVRPDIRVINTSLLGIDWYINQLRYKINESDPIDVIWSEDKIAGEKRNFIYYAPQKGFPENIYIDLYTMMDKIAGSEDTKNMFQFRDEWLNIYPARKVKVPVDVELVKKNGTLNANDSAVSEMLFELPGKAGLDKSETAILNIIAANKWKRPIYFTSPYSSLGFGKFLRLDGMCWRLIPKEGDPINTNWAMEKLMTKFKTGGAQKKGVYFDEVNRSYILNIRSTFAQLAQVLNNQERYEDAKKVLHKIDSLTDPSSLPYAMMSRGNDHNESTFYLAQEAYRAGDKELGDKIATAILKDSRQQLKYYEVLESKDRLGDQFRYERDRLKQFIQQVEITQKTQAGKYPEKVITPDSLKPKTDTAK
ncbi:MAG TPA: DUF2723 domain-containing protein [Chitinophagaceae bacterium]|nr:DUF2723 domain-containing protein [Chitinophagaceae bacterium]